MAVAFEDSTLSYEFGVSGITATRVGFCEWADIADLAAELFPVSTSAGISPGAAFPGSLGLRAHSMSVVPLGERITNTPSPCNTGTLPTFEKAQVTITYEVPSAITGDTSDPDTSTSDPVELLTHSWSVGGEFMTVEGGMRWADANQGVDREDANPGIFIPTIEHSITWPYVLDPPFARIRAATGTVNINGIGSTHIRAADATAFTAINSASISTPLTFDTGALYPESLLFLGAELSRSIMSDGARAWTVTYKFSERTVLAELPNNFQYTVVSGGTTYGVGGWNHYFRNDAAYTLQGYYRMVRENSAVSSVTDEYDSRNAIYLASDHALLFIPNSQQPS